MNLAEKIKNKAIKLGFDIVGITDASPIGSLHVKMFTDWLNAGFAGQMTFLHKNFEKRINPAKLLTDAQSVICVGLNFKPPTETKPPAVKAETGAVVSYARYEDYHRFIKKRLYKLADFIAEITGRELKFKICVDSAPLAERALAQRAGLGFIGKNHMLINPDLGVQFFLGEIITDLKLEIDSAMTADCCDCDKCLRACPTAALKPDGRFATNKCINYLTIAYKGQIPLELAGNFGDRLYGCEQCILVCPYAKDAPICKNEDFKFYNDRAKLDLQEILDLTQQQFDARFADSCIGELGLEGLKRNAEICLRRLK